MPQRDCSLTPAGDYGSLVNDRVVDSNWESADELGKTWCDRNTFSYGRQDKANLAPKFSTSCSKALAELYNKSTR